MHARISRGLMRMAKQLPFLSAGTLAISIQGGAQAQPPPRPAERAGDDEK